MIFKYFRNLSSVACRRSCWRRGAGARRRAADDALLGAYDAYRGGRRDEARAACQERSTGTRSTPWARLLARRRCGWRTRRRRTCRRSLPQHRNTYVARAAARRLAAGARQARRLAGVRARAAARTRATTWRSAATRWLRAPRARRRRRVRRGSPIWLEPKELPEGCERLRRRADARGRISITDVWQRVRVLFENGQITAAKTALGYLPKAEAPDERAARRGGAPAQALPRRACPRSSKRRADARSGGARGRAPGAQRPDGSGAARSRARSASAAGARGEVPVGPRRPTKRRASTTRTR